MTTLREAAQQALEALQNCANGEDDVLLTRDALAALRAALAEPVQQGCAHCNHPLYAAIKCRVCGRVTEPVQEPVAGVVLNEEGRAALVEHGREEWHCVVRNARRLYTAPPQRKPQGCDHCNHPLYAATKCRVCGRVTEVVQEPVAYSEGRTLHWHDGKGVNDAQLYLAPPQRLPLSEDEKRALADKFLSCQPESYEVSGVFDLISAVERAHGIMGGDDVHR